MEDVSWVFQRRCCIYLLYQQNVVIYVGQTTNLLHRIKEHRRKQYDKVMVVWCAESQMDILEGYYIDKYKPKLNKTHNYDVPPGHEGVTPQRLGLKPKKQLGIQLKAWLP